MAEKKEEKEEKKEEKKEPKKDIIVDEVARKRKLFLFAGIGAVAVIVIALGGYFISSSLGSKSAPPQNGAANAKDAAANGKDAAADGKKDGDASANNKDANNKDANNKDANNKDANAASANDKNAGASANDKKDGNAAPDDKNGNQDNGTASGEKKINFGDVYSIPRIDLNLGNPIENRYLRISLAIEYRGGNSQADELHRREAQIKDIIITTVSTKTRMELLDEKGKENLRKELYNKFNEVFDRPINAVYFSEFLVE